MQGLMGTKRQMKLRKQNKTKSELMLRLTVAYRRQNLCSIIYNHNKILVSL